MTGLPAGSENSRHSRTEWRAYAKRAGSAIGCCPLCVRRIAVMPPDWGLIYGRSPLFVGFHSANGAANMISGGIAFGGHLSIKKSNEQESIT